jgi:hypothetical protein
MVYAECKVGHDPLREMEGYISASAGASFSSAAVSAFMPYFR